MKTQAWHWDTQRVVETLALRTAMAAARGRVCPVAATVLARLESLTGAHTC